MAGLIEKDITQPYSFAKFDQQSTDLNKLQAFERANFGCFQEIKTSVRKFKEGQIKANRELKEVDDLIRAYKAMSGSVNNTFNDLQE